jgi:hypothetical protein
VVSVVFDKEEVMNEFRIRAGVTGESIISGLITVFLLLLLKAWILGYVYEWVFIERAGLAVPDFTYWQYVLLCLAWGWFRGDYGIWIAHISNKWWKIEID